MTGIAFDVVEHHRKRTREAERRADHLERRRAELERLLAVCLDVACGHTGVKPLAMLAVLEEMLVQVDEIRALPERKSIDELAQLLRGTDPDGDWRERA